MSRSFFFERLRINVEIFCESVGDMINGAGDGIKRPLFFLVGIALIMTLRSARRGVQSMKQGGLTPPDSRYRAAAYSSYKPYSPSNTAGGMSGSPPGASSGQYSSTSSYSSGSYGSGSGSLSGSSSKPIADLVDQHGAAAKVVDAATFKDYGGIKDFSGQVETLQAFEGARVVEKVLQGPGMHQENPVSGLFW